jgi:nitrite reductase/ring-hydroxylating ferredoxin subunit
MSQENVRSAAVEELKGSGVGDASDRLLFVCPAADVPLGSAIKVEVGELILAVFNLQGAIFVTDDTCTHGPGSLSEGYVEGDVVECNFHQGAFNIRTGAIVAPPCTIPIRTYPVVISEGAVYIDPSARCLHRYGCPRIALTGLKHCRDA